MCCTTILPNFFWVPRAFYKPLIIVHKKSVGFSAWCRRRLAGTFPGHAVDTHHQEVALLSQASSIPQASEVSKTVNKHYLIDKEKDYEDIILRGQEKK
jgi:hypothetical protein